MGGRPRVRSGPARPVPRVRSRASGPARPVLPRYAPGSCCGGSRAAAVASRVLGCPGRAQERRGRTREAPGSAGDDSIRPVVRTLCVGRRNQGPRRSPAGTRMAAGSSNVHLQPMTHRDSPMERGPRRRRDAVPARGALAQSASRQRRGEPAATRPWGVCGAGSRSRPAGRYSARYASRASSVAKHVTAAARSATSGRSVGHRSIRWRKGRTLPVPRGSALGNQLSGGIGCRSIVRTWRVRPASVRTTAAGMAPVLKRSMTATSPA
jgi:hypothetical protein